MSIQRYDLNDYGGMSPYQSGDYVLFTDHAAALAAEVRRLRAKLVQAAIVIASDVYLQSCGSVRAAELAESITGIRLKFEDGKFVEDRT